MLTVFFKSAFRSILRNKTLSLLNIGGLAIGMTVCFFIFQYVHFEQSYEDYNPNAANIYRVPLAFVNAAEDGYVEATNYPAVGAAMKAEFPEVISFARLISDEATLATSMVLRKRRDGTIFSDNEKRVYIGDPRILKMFSIPLIYGNDTDLDKMRGIFLSESMAKKYFGKENPINQTLYMEGSWLHPVCGVFKDLPENTHLKLDMLLSFPEGAAHSENWSWRAFYTYIMVSPGTNIKALEGKLSGFVERHTNASAKEGNLARQIFLQPIKDIHLKSHYRKEMAPNGYESDIWLLSILSIFVLVIAYINYVNLSAARVMERAAEVGVRKVIGASKPQLFFQFLTESVTFNLVSLVLAAIMVFCLTPLYNHILSKAVTGWFWE